MNRRFVLVASVGTFIGLSGCSLLEDPTQVILEYHNQTENDITVFETLHGNEVYSEDNYDINADDVFSHEQEVDDSEPVLLEISLESASRIDYDHTIGVEEDVTVEIIITESGVNFNEIR